MLSTTTKNLGLKKVLPLLIFSGFIVSLFLTTSLYAQSTCNALSSSQPVPTGFGASFNLFSVAKEYLLSGNCGTNSATVTLGNNEPTTYVYNRGHYWNGSSWTPYTLSCSGQTVSSVWCVGRGTASIPLISQPPTHFLGYTCQWNGTKWNCGCRDNACTTNYWQLQLLDNSISPPPPPSGGGTGGGGGTTSGNRDLLIEMDFESGQCNSATFKSNGVYKDSCNIHQASPLKNFTVTNITKGNPAVMTWSGTDPAVYEGVTLGTISSGMTQISGRLVRCQPTGYDANGNTCRLFQDGTDQGIYNNNDGVCRAGGTASCTPVNTTNYGTWSGQTTGTTWERLETQNGGLGPNSTLGVHVASSVRPPSNVNGQADGPVTPLLGNYFLSAQLSYWKDHSTFDGNSDKNKVRWLGYIGPQGGGAMGDLLYSPGEEVCASAAVFLPSNYQHKDISSNYDYGSNEHINFPIEGDNVTIANIRTVGNSGPSGVDHWYLDFNNGSGRTEFDMGSVVPDLNKWTVFTIRMKTGTNGTLKVWKSEGNYLSGTKQRSDVLKYSRVGAPVGDNTTSFRFHVRQYLHGWHHRADFMPGSTEQWVGFDEIRLTRFAQDGGTCQDVHPFRVNLQ